ncbi:MAG: (Na+)-NQR maturation NqrM [Planctomycetota bacterium]
MTGYEIVLVVLLVMSAFAIAGLGMAIGWLLANKPLKGSCGGLATMTDENGNSICMACGDDPADCDGETASPTTVTAAADHGPDAAICDSLGCSTLQRSACSTAKQADCTLHGGPQND